jgi:DNA-binding NarL/FixJ family response regulator
VLVPARIAIVDNQELVRSLLVPAFDRDPEFNLQYQSSSGLRFLREARFHQLDVLLVSSEIKDVPAPDLIKRVKSRSDLVVICLDYDRGEAFSGLAVEAGVDGLISTLTHSFLTLLEDIKISIAKTSVDEPASETISEKLTSKELAIQKSIHISDREADILRLMIEGDTGKEIASTLKISPRTVEKHRSSMGKKTKCKNAASLVAFALRNRIVE